MIIIMYEIVGDNELCVVTCEHESDAQTVIGDIHNDLDVRFVGTCED